MVGVAETIRRPRRGQKVDVLILGWPRVLGKRELAGFRDGLSLSPRTDIMSTERAVGHQGDGRRYGIVHARWTEHEDIGADEIAVLAVLSTYADRAGWCGVSQSTLGTRLKRSRSWTNKVLQRLEAAGIIRIEQLRERGRILGCRYLIIGHADVCRGNHQCQDEQAGQGRAPSRTPSDHVVDHVVQRHTESPGKHKPDSLSAREERGGCVDKELVGETTAEAFPVGWSPSTEDLTWAVERRPDLGGQLPTITEKFHLNARAHGLRYADISAAWRCWVLRERTSHHALPRSHAHAARIVPTDLAARNRSTARDCLERVLARRSGHLPS